MLVTIFCRRAGLIRGGVRHPEFASYPPTQFSEAQLREMIADRDLTVVVGHQLTADRVFDFVQAAAEGAAMAAARAKVSTDAPPEAIQGTAPAGGEGKPPAGKARKGRA